MALTEPQIVSLAAAISANSMTAIAERYMDIAPATVKNLRENTNRDLEAFNREIIRTWAYKNSENQTEKLAQILYKAATDCGYVDPERVEQILKIAQEVNFSDLTQLAEDLRPHTAKSMKMEPVPWIIAYVVDMEELYTELSLEKIDKKLFREERIELENYKVLFAHLKPGMFEYLDIRYYTPKLMPKTKILFKGNPGMGKTSLVKKIAYDWAKGDFDVIFIVFFVFLKTVKPGDLIENVIMLQNPVLTGLHVTTAKVANILDRFGPKCLLILDGLDECALGPNHEVINIIKGAKFLNCNVILTSRPHSTREFEVHFDTIVSVEGFTLSEARKFAGCIVDDERKVEQILHFNPAGERADHSVHNVPILLSFLSLLVKEENIDLSNTSITMGEIYFRMVRCLYKKYTIRKGIEYDESSFVKVLESLCKLALETLLSGKPLLKRSKIIEEVGEEVFDYGLLIGHDGYSLTRDMAGDILVTFPHRSILEFLGSLCFVLSLGEKQTVKSADEAFRQYLGNPLFSQFCLWFLDESNSLFSFPERSVASDRLIRYTAEKIDNSTINFFQLVNTFPALGLALDDRNHLALGMLKKALRKCRKPKDLAVGSKHPFILTSFSDNVFGSLKSIKIHGEDPHEDVRQVNKAINKLIPWESPLHFLHSETNNDLHIVFEVSSDKSNSDCFVSVLNTCGSMNRSVRMVLTSSRSVSGDLTRHDLDRILLRENLPALHTLILTSDGYSLMTVARANAEHKLPNLCGLDIRGDFKMGHLHKLFTGIFASLTTLILSDCDLNKQDLTSLTEAIAEGKLPELKHLDISGVSLDKSFYFTALDLSNTIFISGHLSVLLGQTWSSLNILILRKCRLNPDDMRSIACANVENRLPQLKLLDVSQNHIGYGSTSTVSGRKSGLGCLPELLSHLFPWLAYLILCDCLLNESDLDILTRAKLDRKLPAVKCIDVSFNNLTGHLGLLTRTGRELPWYKIVCFDKFLDGSKILR